MKLAIAAMLGVLLATAVVLGQGAKPAAAAGAQTAVAPITGHCHCGALQYEIRGPVLRCSYCSCPGCQRASGTLRVPFLTVRRAAVQVTAGELAEFQAKQGVKCDADGVWQFCPKCGTQVFWKGHRGDELDVFAGTLDNTALFQAKD